MRSGAPDLRPDRSAGIRTEPVRPWPGETPGRRAGVRRRRPASRAGPGDGPRARIPWLGLVAAVYALLQLLVVVPRIGHTLGWDESVYVSQVDPRTPAAFFSAPRSRGISFLVAPVLAATPSVLALRLALTAASAAALYASFRVWRTIVGPGTTALAALLFAGVWTTGISGAQAMPNLWVAFGAVAAVGWFLRFPCVPGPDGGAPGAPRTNRATGVTRPGDSPRDPRAQDSPGGAPAGASPLPPPAGGSARGNRAGWWLAGCLAATALVRTPDAGWLALPLLVCAVLMRSWRRTLPYLLGGLALGAAQWTAEAYVRWGSVPARLHVSSATEGGMGLHLNVGNAWRALNGPQLCRPCTVPLTHPELTLWWLALPVLAATALALSLRDRAPRATVLPVACAASLAVPYLLLLDYAAPRFLLPSYALLALPVAGLATRLVRAAADGRTRRTAVAAVAVLVLAQLASQQVVLDRMARSTAAVNAEYRAAAHGLHALGLRPPCLVTGTHALPVAYAAGCASAQTSGNNRSVTRTELLRLAARRPTAALTGAHAEPPSYARDWTPHPLPGTHWTAWVAH
ncbi:hypothetical protein ACWCP6_03025 [Streptomyces sp. NPDC002004]